MFHTFAPNLVLVEVTDIITCNKFFGNWLKGSNFWGVKIGGSH